MRLVLLTSDPAGNAARIADVLLRRRLPEVEVAGCIVDLGTSADRRRQRRRLRAWLRHGGPGYALWRLWLIARDRLRRPPPRPRYRRSLHDLGREHGFPVVEVPNVNSAAAKDALRELRADLALSVGNRVIVESVFSIPRLGTINLHHGRLPDYRGGPPAFWELLNGETSMGVSVHRIDALLDHGELLARDEVPIEPGDDPRTLMERARSIDHVLVVGTVAALAAGTAEPIPVEPAARSRANTLPSRRELRALQRRLGRRVRHDDFRWAPLVPPADA